MNACRDDALAVSQATGQDHRAVSIALHRHRSQGQPRLGARDNPHRRVCVLVKQRRGGDVDLARCRTSLRRQQCDLANRAESDARQNGPPGQIQYLYTKAYDLTGKPGIVIAFDSAYEQNQDSLAALEYSVDGTNYNPILYWIQGDYDSQAPADVIRDGLGNIDVNKTMTTTYGDVAMYTDPTSNKLVGGYYGFFIKAPITQALAPYIEGRYNDDGKESKRIELYRVPLADNQKNVTFRFVQAGTSSWYWAIDNWGIYSVPTESAQPSPGVLSVGVSNGQVTISWTGGGTLQSASDLTGTWSNVPNAQNPLKVTPTGGQQFYRLH